MAASGVKSLRKSFELVEENSPLRRNVTTDDVGGTAVYLASDLSSGVSGQNLFVDAGISSVAIS